MTLEEIGEKFDLTVKGFVRSKKKPSGD